LVVVVAAIAIGCGSWLLNDLISRKSLEKYIDQKNSDNDHEEI
jgi:hypothetical protein